MMSSPFLWQEPPPALALRDDAFHLWKVELDVPDATRARVERLLAPDERARAERFYFDRDRRNYVIGRAALRAIVARYVGIAPRKLEFVYGPQGKPALVRAQNAIGLELNLAHSHRLALCAVARGAMVGVDVEYVRALPDAMEIAERYFSAAEVGALRAQPSGERLQAFFGLWTLKEAYVKAIGEGLSCGLDQFEVKSVPGEPVRLASIGGDRAQAHRWSLVDFAPEPGYVGAAAIEGAGRAPTYLRWNHSEL
jgi:4'-phosphopantetheinyl transferase